MPASYNEAVYRMVSKWTETTRISFVKDAKRPGTKSYERYQSYSQARYVGEALRLGAKPEDLVHDYAKKYCKMHKDQRVKVPEGIMGEEEKAIFRKFLKHMRGPSGCNMRKVQAKKLKALEKLKKLGIDFKDMRGEKNGQETNDLQALRLAADCAAGELLAEAETAGRKISEKDVMRVLELWAFRKNESRLNVLPKGKQWVNSDTLGLIRDRTGKFIVTAPTRDYPNFMTVLTRYLTDRRPAELECDFPFTTISLNYGYAAKRHRDSGNLGPSMIKAFGKFKGGQLNYWPDDDKNTSLENLRDEDKVSMDLSQGLALFDGNRAHEVDPFTGERFSLVYFSIDKYWKATTEVLDSLRERNYSIPTEETMALARTLLPAPRGYASGQSLTSMFGVNEKPKVYQWIESQESDAAPTVPIGRGQVRTVQTVQKPQQKEVPKSADLKALFMGVCTPARGAEPSSPAEAAAGAAEESPKPDATPKCADLKAMFSGAAPAGQKNAEGARTPLRSDAQEEAQPSSTPPRKESLLGGKRSMLTSGKKAKKAKTAEQGTKASKAKGAAKEVAEASKEPAGTAMEEEEEAPRAEELAKETLPTAEELASSKFCPAEAQKGVRWSSLLARALQVAVTSPEASIVSLSNTFRALLHASEDPLNDLCQALESLMLPAADRLPPKALREAVAQWGTAKAGNAEVLRALAQAFALTRPARASAPAEPRTFASEEGRRAMLAAMERALARAHGESGGRFEPLLRALLADCRPAELYCRCGPRCGAALLPMAAQETRDLEVLLSELAGSAVLVEQCYPGQRLQVHKSAAGSLAIFSGVREVAGTVLEEALMSALRESIQARECIVEAVLQRDAQEAPEGVLQVFDCLWQDGRPLVRRSLRQRRAALEQVLRPCGSVRIPPSEEFALEDPPTAEVLGSLLEEAGACNCRGVMVKRLEREYEAGCTSSACYALLRPGA